VHPPPVSVVHYQGDMEQAQFYRCFALNAASLNYDDYEWSGAKRKCQVQREYGLHLHSLSSVARTVFFNNWLREIYSPIRN
jgi:hypothetical protein